MKDLFYFLNDENYKLMMDMSKELHSENEVDAIKQRFQDIDKAHFFSLCLEHELDGVVGYFAKTIGCVLPDNWSIKYDEEKEKQEFLKNKALEVCSIMNSAGIPMVVLKNGGIMISMIGDAVKCPMEDIDSLIKKKDFYRAHQILEENGFVFKFRSEFEKEKIDEAFRHGSAEYYFIMNNGEKMWFELSWRAIDGRWIRPDREPDTNSLIDKSFMPVNTYAHILSPEDNLLQVCIHTAKHSYVRAPGLRLHLDVDRIVSHEKIDWNVFIRKVKDVEVTKAVYLSLYIPSVLFGTNIPETVLNELKPKNANMLLRMLSHAQLPHPHEKKFSKIGFLLFQVSLYDSFNDVVRVVYPGKQWIMEKYGCSEKEIVKYVFIRFLDLIGIRRKK